MSITYFPHWEEDKATWLHKSLFYALSIKKEELFFYKYIFLFNFHHSNLLWIDEMLIRESGAPVTSSVQLSPKASTMGLVNANKSLYRSKFTLVLRQEKPPFKLAFSQRDACWIVQNANSIAGVF